MTDYKEKKSILIISHYYPPEVGAPQARLSEMAKYWKKSGYKITVLTCFPNHPDGIIKKGYENKSYLVENFDGIRVCRVSTFATANSGFMKKIICHILFMVNAVRQGRWAAKQSDIIIVSSPTFFSVISAYVFKVIYKKPYIFEVRDLWPAIFKDLEIINNKFLLFILEKIEIFLYKKASKVVTVTQSFAKDISSRGINPEKIHTIYNGVDLNNYNPIVKNVSLAKDLNLNKKFIVLYIGAHGISQGLETLIDVAKKAKKINQIHFLFVGDGAKKQDLIKKVISSNIKNVTFVDNQPKDKVKSFYSIADVVCVPLRNIPLFDSFIPSKIFEIMAMQKPIIASLAGEAANILANSGGALLSKPEDHNHIFENILFLYKNPEESIKMGSNGRKYVVKNFDRRLLSKNYQNIFQSIL